MQVSRAAAIWLEYHRSHSRKSTLKSYQAAMGTFLADFRRQADRRDLHRGHPFLPEPPHGGQETPDQTSPICPPLGIFNFIRKHLDPEFRNPCDTPAMKRLFRSRTPARWDTLDKDTVDEVIFKTVKIRDRLMLELMARGGMRVGEVLKLTANDVNERKLTLREPRAVGSRKPSLFPRRWPTAEGLSERKVVQTGRPDFPDLPTRRPERS